MSGHAPSASGYAWPMKTADPGFCASQLKTLADDTRLAVVRELMRGPRRVGELMQSLEVEQSLLSHHLRILRDANIVSAERDGKSVLYRLTPRVMQSENAAPRLDLGCCKLSFN